MENNPLKIWVPFFILVVLVTIWMGVSHLFQTYGLLFYVGLFFVGVAIHLLSKKDITDKPEKKVNPSDRWVQYNYQRLCSINPEWESLLEKRESLGRIDKYNDIPRWFYTVWKYNKNIKTNPNKSSNLTGANDAPSS